MWKVPICISILIGLISVALNIDDMRLFGFLKQDEAFRLDKVLSQNDETKILIEIDSYLNKKSDYGDRIELLSGPQQVFLFIENLEREINNGGFNQFYFNSAGDFSHETVEALQTIGAVKVAEIVRRANAQFPHGKVPGDQEERREVLFEIEDKADLVWEECDQSFYKYEEPIGALLLKYVRLKKADFEK